MVHKRKTASSLNRSAQIDPPSAHIAPHFTLPLSSGTLPSRKSGCIPEQPPFIKATPAPIHPTPQSANPAQSTSPPPSGSAPRPRARFKQQGRVLPAWFPPWLSSASSAEGWNTEEEDKISESSGDFNPYLFDSNEYNNPHQHGNILLDDLANGLNAIVFSLNDSDDEYSPNLRLRETYIGMLQGSNSTVSLDRLQTAAARLLTQLLEEHLFVTGPDSCNALRGLMASMLSHPSLDLDLDDIATGEDKLFPISPG